MIFGDHLAPADSAAPAAWLEGTVDIRRASVGGLLPRHFDRYLLVEAAPPALPDWWGAQRRIVSALARVLARFTATPDKAWFAIWEGHGFDHPEVPAPPGAEHRGERRTDGPSGQQARSGTPGAGVPPAAALRRVPRFDLPDRSYYLVHGPVTAVQHLRWPGEPDRWFRPDLWWPQDRGWFVATDVDFWSTYVGGTAAMAEAVTTRLPGRCRPVALDEPLRAEG